MGAAKWSAAAVAAILSTTSLVSANPLRYCPPGAPNRAVCLEYAIPDATARNGAGNVYFKISAPTSMAWAAFGTGDGMSGANIFVLYQDGKGNVTLSPRTTTGHNPPQLDSSATGAKLTLLSGSGVSGDTMTAVVRCSNCLSWSNGGSMRAADNAAPFISAWKAGSSLATTNQAQGISRHDGRDIFGLDLTQARIAQDSNPFVTGQTGNPSSPSSPNTPTSPGNAPNDAGVTTFAGPNMAILAAHGIVMAIAFVLLYPLGSLLMAIVRKWQLHAASQMVAYLLMWAGLALGVVAANERKTLFANDAKTHTILGVVVVALLGVQPVFGWLHHMHFVKNQRRGVISHLHIWYGRILLIIGVINGGIGLRIASASYPMIIAYAVVAGVVYVLYAASSVFGEFRRKKQAPLLKESVSPPYQQQPY